MRISDWSSDVCSSDLVDVYLPQHDARCSSLGQIDVDAASEPNETDSLPPCHHISGLHKGHNPSGHQADRTSVVEGKSVSVSVDLGGRSIIKKIMSLTPI